MSSGYIQVDESTLMVIDNEKHRAVKGYIWAARDAVCGDVYFHYDMESRGGETARRLIGGYRGTSRLTATRSTRLRKCPWQANDRLLGPCKAQVRRSP